jgi:hypothetical protein
MAAGKSAMPDTHRARTASLCACRAHPCACQSARRSRCTRVVVVQQTGLAGAVPAVARVEHPWLVVVLEQHGLPLCIGIRLLTGTLRARLG